MVPGVLHAFLNQPAELEPVGRCLDLMARVVAETGGGRVPEVPPSTLTGVRP
jgi:hypothetical protein